MAEAVFDGETRRTDRLTVACVANDVSSWCGWKKRCRTTGKCLSSRTASRTFYDLVLIIRCPLQVADDLELASWQLRLFSMIVSNTLATQLVRLMAVEGSSEEEE